MDDYIYTMDIPCMKAKRHNILRAFKIQLHAIILKMFTGDFKEYFYFPGRGKD